MHAVFDRFTYKEWTTPHISAVPETKEWDKQDKFSSASQQCVEPEPEDDDVTANICLVPASKVL
jgi:hypothetical protein